MEENSTPKRRKTHTSSTVKDRYNRKAYDDIKLRVKKGEKAQIQKYAEEAKKSVNAYITEAIQYRQQSSKQESGIYIHGTQDEIVKMLEVLDAEKIYSYSIDFSVGYITGSGTVAELINFLDSSDYHGSVIEIKVMP